MQAAWGLLLSAYSAEDKASYCTVYFGRSERRTLSTVTMMVHTIPVFVQTEGDMTLGEVQEKAGIPIRVVPNNGESFIKALYGLEEN